LNGRFCCILNAASINLTWLLTVLGIIVGGASIPVGLILLWSKMSTLAVLLSPWIGFFSGLIAWFVVTHLRSGAINVTTTGDATNAVAGNITSWGVGFLSSIVISLVAPRKFESTDEDHIARANKINGVSPQARSPEIHTPAEPSGVSADEKAPISPFNTADSNPEPPSNPKPDTLVRTGNEIVDFLEAQHIEPMDHAEVKKATRLAVGFNVLFLVVAILFVPFLLFGGEWIFPRKMFVGWCVVSFIWVWCSMVICVIWPVVESRVTIWRIMRGVVRDAGTGGKGKAQKVDQAEISA
jgi:hypothetical protein